MFGMGLGEIFFIAVIAVLFLGPDKLPDAMVQIAKFFRSLKRTVNDAKLSIEEEIKIGELKEEALRYKKQLDEATRSIEQGITADLNDPIDPEEASTPHEESDTAPTAVEPKREKITFPKKRRAHNVYAPREADGVPDLPDTPADTHVSHPSTAEQKEKHV